MTKPPNPDRYLPLRTARVVRPVAAIVPPGEAIRTNLLEMAARYTSFKTSCRVNSSAISATVDEWTNLDESMCWAYFSDLLVACYTSKFLTPKAWTIFETSTSSQTIHHDCCEHSALSAYPKRLAKSIIFTLRMSSPLRLRRLAFQSRTICGVHLIPTIRSCLYTIYINTMVGKPPSPTLPKASSLVLCHH